MKRLFAFLLALAVLFSLCACNGTSIVIPATTTTIGNQAFGECTSLSNIFTELDAIPAEWDSEWCGKINVTIHFAGCWHYEGSTPTPNS